MYAAPAYWLYEMGQASLNPARAFADAGKLFFKNPANPWSHTELGKTVAAACELFERSTRRYGKPEWNIASTLIGAERVPVQIKSVWERPFCRLLHFERAFEHPPRRPQPRLLIVAPMSGHYATLLRGTVEGFLPNHDVYITEWVDARVVPVSEGSFDLDDYIDYVISMLHFLGGDVHVIAVCQPSVPVLAAVARMEADGDPHVPHSMVLMGGPIDTRINPTEVNLLAGRRGIDWFRRNVITKVPFPNPGFMRDVYPGFLQLYGFVSMNLDRHMEAHRNLYLNLVKGDGDSAQKHREFYDEYLAVMDLCAEYLSADLRHRFHPACVAEGRDDPSRHSDRSVEDQARGADDGRGRERRHLGRRPDRSRARAVHEHPEGSASTTGCSPTSGTTACSTARASAPRSRRASPISCSRTTAAARAARRASPAPAAGDQRDVARRQCRPPERNGQAVVPAAARQLPKIACSPCSAARDRRKNATLSRFGDRAHPSQGTSALARHGSWKPPWHRVSCLPRAV